jgi:hypothetical protein
VRGRRNLFERTYSDKLFGNEKTSRVHGVPTQEYYLSHQKHDFLVSSCVQVTIPAQCRPLAVLIRTTPFRVTRQVVASGDRPLCHCSLSYLILLHMPHCGDPARIFVVHESTPIDRGATINNVVRSTTAVRGRPKAWGLVRTGPKTTRRLPQREHKSS